MEVFDYSTIPKFMQEHGRFCVSFKTYKKSYKSKKKLQNDPSNGRYLRIPTKPLLIREDLILCNESVMAGADLHLWVKYRYYLVCYSVPTVVLNFIK